LRKLEKKLLDYKISPIKLCKQPILTQITILFLLKMYLNSSYWNFSTNKDHYP